MSRGSTVEIYQSAIDAGERDLAAEVAEREIMVHAAALTAAKGAQHARRWLWKVMRAIELPSEPDRGIL